MVLPWHSIDTRVLKGTLPLSVFYSLCTIPVFFESGVQLSRIGWAVACAVALVAYLSKWVNAERFEKISQVLNDSLLEIMFFCVYPFPMTAFFIVISFLVRNVVSIFIARSGKSQSSRSALLLDLGIYLGPKKSTYFPAKRTTLCLGLCLLVMILMDLFPEWRPTFIWVPFSAFAGCILSVLSLRNKIET